MSVFTALLTNILPLYAIVAMGYFAGRVLKVDRHSVAQILFYLVLPVVFFAVISKTEVESGLLTLPVLMFFVSTLMCLAAFQLSKFFWQDKTRNILALMAGTANTGYFGLPVAQLLFDAHTVGLYFSAMLGMTVFESSVGYYITARGHHTARDALIKVLKLPTIYAFAAGILAAYFGFVAPAPMEVFFGWMKGTYVITGMMIVGLGLAGARGLELDGKFTVFALVVKCVAWPLVMLSLVALDRNFLGLYDVNIHHALLLLSIVPLPANAVVFATLLHIHPEKVAATVLLSTLLALAYVPLMVALLF